VFVKICGLSTPAAVAAAVEAGADAVGFVFAPSPREVTPERARELCAGVPRTVARVAVMRHPPAELVRRVLDVFEPDWLQTDAEDFDGFDLPARVAALPVYRNRGPRPGQGVERLLFEGSVSGSGQTADWDEARALALGRELVLAGGLDADNVTAAIEAVRPWGVDVSSGVERRRGEKDPVKIEEFVARVRAWETSQ
jgi:phosphoribosylanthranilate isomerase